MPDRLGGEKAIVTCETIKGVFSVALETHRDPRGELTEIFRQSWVPTRSPLQWNLLLSEAGALRGVHVHIRHTDYVTAISGATWIGLKDLRRSSPSFLKDARYELDPSSPRLLHIPPGVAHGFYAPTGSLLCVATSHYFDPQDELGYRWDDPAGLIFPEVREPIVSPRDAQAQTFTSLLTQLDPHQARLYA